MLPLILVVLFVLLGSAFCALSETAILSVSPIKVRQLAQSKKRSEIALFSLRARIHRSLATVVILNNIFNIVGSIIIGGIATNVFGDAGFGIFSAFLTLLIIMFGEIIPKTLGERHALAIALWIALPVKGLVFILAPVVWFVERATIPFLRGKRKPTTNEAEIKFLARIGHQEGIIEDDEADMIQRVFNLNDLLAHEIMTPRTVMTYLRGNSTLEEVKEDIIASQHSRIVVIDETIDDAIGLALKNELLLALLEGKTQIKITDLSREVRFVAETMKADKLLQEFQKKREHLFVVADEYGGVSGVVTLEDVLEVLTGEIVDETDRTADLQEIARKRRKRILEEN
ncbi:MAG: hemolysin family protein [Cyanobacteria bacterium P01_E01_bin.42]